MSRRVTSTTNNELQQVRERQAQEWRQQNRLGGSGTPGNNNPSNTSSLGSQLVTWVKKRKWLVIGAAGVAGAILSRPGEKSFKSFMEMQTGGSASRYLRDSLAWLGWKSVGSVTSYGLFSLARQGQRKFVGALGTWIELPSTRKLTHVGSAEQDLEVIIGTNVLVWLAWQVANEGTMTKHFTVNSTNAERRPHTLLSSAFSHIHPAHLLNNMHTLIQVAPFIQAVIGRPHFLLLYLGGGVCSSLMSVGYHRAAGSPHTSSVGASGAVYSLLSFNSLLLPDQLYSYWGGITLNAPQFLATRVAIECLDVTMGLQNGIDVFGHAGGAMFGAVYYILLKNNVSASKMFI